MHTHDESVSQFLPMMLLWWVALTVSDRQQCVMVLIFNRGSACLYDIAWIIADLWKVHKWLCLWCLIDVPGMIIWRGQTLLLECLWNYGENLNQHVWPYFTIKALNQHVRPYFTIKASTLVERMIILHVCCCILLLWLGSKVTESVLLAFFTHFCLLIESASGISLDYFWDLIW